MNKMYPLLLIFVIITVGGWLVVKKMLVVPPGTNDGSQVSVPTSAPGIQEITESTTQNTIVQNQITLTIVSPLSNTTVTTNTVAIRGKTVANADVFVNDSETKADSGGNFSVSLTLDEGENPIIVVANDANGNSAEQEIMVTYSAG